MTSDLTRLGYQVRHVIVRASDVGAPHQRARVFLLATRPGYTLPTVADEYPALDPASQLLPTPTASESTGPGDHGTGAPNLRTVVSLLPTPRASDGPKGGPNQRGSKGDLTLSSAVHDFGPYAQAVARWERVTGRRAPAPTEPGQRGGRRLSAEFASWMMGLPREWITGVPGVTRTGALTMCGNGVVPQQAAQAIRVLAREQTDDYGTPNMLDMLTEVAA